MLSLLRFPADSEQFLTFAASFGNRLILTRKLFIYN